MTKRAVGAMLFGGTLGLAQAAAAVVVNAGGTVTFLNTAPGTGPGPAISASYLQAGPISAYAFNSFAAGSFSTQNAGNTLFLSWTDPVAAGGWPQSITMQSSRLPGTSSTSTADTVSADFYRVFTVTGGFAVWEGSLSNNNSTSVVDRYFGIYNVDATTGVATTTAFSFQSSMSGSEVQNFSGTLAEGTYQFYVSYRVSQGTNLSTFATFNIPAPGAVALLGAAGLIGSRRRRN